MKRKALESGTLLVANIDAVSIVVVDVVPYQPVEMTLIWNDHLIEELLMDRPEPASARPFCHGLATEVGRDSIPSWGMESRSEREKIASLSWTRSPGEPVEFGRRDQV